MCKHNMCYLLIFYPCKCVHIGVREALAFVPDSVWSLLDADTDQNFSLVEAASAMAALGGIFSLHLYPRSS